MNDYIDLNDTKEYLNILLRATKNLKKMVDKDKTDIDILFGDDGMGKYFVQFTVDQEGNEDFDLNIANNLKDFNSAHKLGTILSNLYDLELVEF